MGTKFGKGKVGLRALFDIKMDNVSQANAANYIWHKEKPSLKNVYIQIRGSSFTAIVFLPMFIYK